MTKEEFLRGWTLLVLQPWGKRYAGHDTSAKLQFELYYDRLGRYQVEAWEVACKLFASGEKWPSVHEIRDTLNNSLPSRYQITSRREDGGEEKPELLVKIEAYRNLAIEQPTREMGMEQSRRNGTVTILEAAEKVLPEYAKENPGPEHGRDIELCERMIKQLKAHRAHRQVLQQEKAVKV